MAKDILFFISTMGGGGSERVVSLLSKSLAEKGNNVYIITMHNKGSAYSLHENIHLLSVSELPVCSFFHRALTSAYQRFYLRLRQKLILPVLRKLKFEPIEIEETLLYFYIYFALPCRGFLKSHSEATAFAFLAPAAISLAMASKRTKVKTVFCERNYPMRFDWCKKTIRQRNRFARKYRYSVYQTEAQKQYYDSFIKGEKWIIPNPVKSELPLPYNGQRTKRIVNFCRLHIQKNLPLLIDAFSEIHYKYPEYFLEIYGDGTERDYLIKIIKEKHLDSVISIKPFNANIHQAVLDAAMFVSTSDFEGMSNSMLEAMAIGLPCVCTDCDGGGAREIINNGVNGLLVPKGDKAAVANAIEKLITEPDFAETLSKNAVRVREDYSEDKIIQKWIEVI